MKLVYCTKCRFVYADPGGKEPLEKCPQCFNTGGGKLLDVPPDVIATMVATGFKNEAYRQQYTRPVFPVATTPPDTTNQEGECRPA